jgi:hypothetical protein
MMKLVSTALGSRTFGYGAPRFQAFVLFFERDVLLHQAIAGRRRFIDTIPHITKVFPQLQQLRLQLLILLPRSCILAGGQQQTQRHCQSSYSVRAHGPLLDLPVPSHPTTKDGRMPLLPQTSRGPRHSSSNGNLTHPVAWCRQGSKSLGVEIFEAELTTELFPYSVTFTSTVFEFPSFQDFVLLVPVPVRNFL